MCLLGGVRRAGRGKRRSLEAFPNFRRAVLRRTARQALRSAGCSNTWPSSSTTGISGSRPGSRRNRPTPTHCMSALGEDEKPEDVLPAYDKARARSRKIAAAFQLDHVLRQEESRSISLSRICTRMIEQTARHAGHAEIPPLPKAPAAFCLALVRPTRTGQDGT
jgi:hypothetical protein